jgi:hypothetical protein
VFVITDDYNTLSLTDTSSSNITVGAVDGGALAGYDISSLDTGAPASENVSVGLNEQSTTYITSVITDSLVIDLSEQASNFVTSATSDESVIGVGESTSIVKFINVTDSAAVNVDDQSGRYTERTIDVTDDVSLSVTEQSDVFTNSPGYDTSGVQVSEQASITVGGGITLNGEDAVTLSVSEGASVSISINSSDASSWSIDETTSGAVNASGTDGNALRVADSRNTASSTTTTDTSGIAVNETNHVALFGAAYGDSLSLNVAEQAFITPIMLGHDPVSVAVSETSSIVTSGTLTKGGTDGMLIGLAEQAFFAIYLDRTDTTGIRVAEQASFATIVFTTSDTGSLVVSETIIKPAYASDEMALALSELANVLATEHLSSHGDSDTLTVYVSERSRVWLIGGENVPTEFASKHETAIISSTSSRDGKVVETRHSDNRRSESTTGRKIRVE